MRGFGCLGVLLVGCVGGPEAPGVVGGGGDEDTAGPADTAADTDTAEVVEPPPVLTVCSDGTADYLTPQEAVAAAPDGAILELCGEVVTGSVVIDSRTLTLHGAPGAVLDGGGTERALVVQSTSAAADVTVEGITLTHGFGEAGGGVWCDNATLTLTDVVVTANEAQQGGGIATVGCVVTLTRTEVSSNLAWGEGGGGRLEGGSATIADGVVASNVGADGGGLKIVGATGVTSGTLFESNLGDVGGGIWFDSAYTFTRNVLRGNSARFTGGGFAGYLHSGDISYNEIYENTCETDGGGGFTEHGTGRVLGNSFHDNVATDDAGGLRMLYGGAVMERNTFRSNVASGGDGGAMKVSHNKSDIRNNLFEDNTAGGRGGAIEIDDDNSSSTGNVFRRNQAGSDGGAVSMALPFWDIELHDSVFEDNVAGRCGGGIAFLGKLFGFTASHLEMSGNQAKRGGAICASAGSMTLENAVLHDNAADEGGALAFADVAFSLSNLVVDGSVGGGLVTDGLGVSRVSDSIFTANEGGAVVAHGAAPAWRYSLVWDNEGDAFVGMDDPSGANGNLSVDPSFVGVGDFHLAASSPAVDAGDPARMDADGSRGDLGAFGGAGGDW
jgi:hypothetical protein